VSDKKATRQGVVVIAHGVEAGLGFSAELCVFSFIVERGRQDGDRNIDNVIEMSGQAHPLEPQLVPIAGPLKGCPILIEDLVQLCATSVFGAPA